MFTIKHRTTPDNIVHLKVDEIFVFGSNRGGNHGKGGAKTAKQWGARTGIGEGLSGNTYAIPTKMVDYRFSLPIDRIREHVNDFIEFAKARPDKKFMVTAIGTGYAHYTVKQMAPLFAKAKDIENIHLPASFWKIILSETNSTKSVDGSGKLID